MLQSSAVYSVAPLPRRMIWTGHSNGRDTRGLVESRQGLCSHTTPGIHYCGWDNMSVHIVPRHHGVTRVAFHPLSPSASRHQGTNCGPVPQSNIFTIISVLGLICGYEGLNVVWVSAQLSTALLRIRRYYVSTVCERRICCDPRWRSTATGRAGETLLAGGRWER